MSIIRNLTIAAALISLIASCDTTGTHRLPPETPINHGAGRGNFLFVTCRIGSQSNLLFLVDTGMAYTMVDQSLEAALGRCVYTNEQSLIWYPSIEFHVYRAPKIFLGDTSLKMRPWLQAADLRKIFRNQYDKTRKVSGVLGLDCLTNYCL
jgi:hypothetical protein